MPLSKKFVGTGYEVISTAAQDKDTHRWTPSVVVAVNWNDHIIHTPLDLPDIWGTEPEEAMDKGLEFGKKWAKQKYFH